MRARRLQPQVQPLTRLERADRLGDERVPLRIGAEIGQHAPHLLGRRRDVDGDAHPSHHPLHRAPRAPTCPPTAPPPTRQSTPPPARPSAPPHPPHPPSPSPA